MLRRTRAFDARRRSVVDPPKVCAVACVALRASVPWTSRSRAPRVRARPGQERRDSGLVAGVVIAERPQEIAFFIADADDDVGGEGSGKEGVAYRHVGRRPEPTSIRAHRMAHDAVEEGNANDASARASRRTTAPGNERDVQALATRTRECDPPSSGFRQTFNRRSSRPTGTNQKNPPNHRNFKEKMFFLGFRENPVQGRL